MYGKAMVFTMSQLEAALALSWDEKTAYHNEWNPLCPAMNQCAVTALVVQDYFGGIIVSLADESHWWNILDEAAIDLTGSQFAYSGDIPFYDEPETRTRDYLLSNPDTRARYELLAERVEWNICVVLGAFKIR